ncbi:MAG: DUF4159 domain-containing protein [Magnetospirillum sp.]|nr:DUF4159 domain-containing protein [Magnetospirillum sp.]
MALGPLAFSAPWALAGLAVLPALWWLLRVTPPVPRTIRFPAIRLLFGLDARQSAAAHTPLWVLLLRLVLAAMVIVGVAGPLWHPGPPMSGRGPLMVAIDDGWAAARDWSQRRAWLDALLARAQREGRAVLLVPTAPPADGSPIEVRGPMPAVDARAAVQALVPKPWGSDRAAAAGAVGRVGHAAPMEAVWLADGLDDGSGTRFVRALQALGGGVEVVTGRTARALMPPAETADPGRLDVPVRRFSGLDDPDVLVVRALDGAGRPLGRQEVALAPGQSEATAHLRLPVELRNKLVRLDIENESSAAAVVLIDERWRRRPVGLVAGGSGATAPLLDQLYYIDKALAPVADLHRGDLSELLAGKVAVLMLADVPAILGTTADRLDSWVSQGGVLVRFAGPALAHAAAQAEPGETDPFLPVRLHGGDRSLGGAMSWTAPMGLAPFPESGPFAGIAIPADVKVSAQVLAEPVLELESRTWARLTDGTPLVTAARHGKGWVVLVHTTANAEWSNLALSGLFPQMLRRLVLLAEGMPGKGGGPLPPVEVLDGLGRLGAPTGAASAIVGDPATAVPGPRHPPGLYGEGGMRVALNLGAAVGQPRFLPVPAGIARSSLSQTSRELDLRPPLLALALAMAVADLLVALGLRGLLGRRSISAALVALALIPLSAHADDSDAFALQAALQTRLAYVRTGDAATDAKSRAGLIGLTQVLARRSTAELAEPMGLDLATDPVLFFPLLYWPVTPDQPPVSPAVADKLNAYLHHGGLIVFDSGDGGVSGGGQSERLRALTQGLDIPPLAPVTGEHVLTRAFYLLKDMPGRYEGGTVWAQDGAPADNDGVSPVIVGGSDWAGAWAVDAAGRPMFATVPGGERQREMAYRFGINLVMYALTGNYKADQVHLPAILERLNR